MAFTEFYCDASTGANINAGDLTANGVVTSTNGDWGNAVANRFTAAAGTPFSGVSVGDFASVYVDGATVAVYIARVTAVNGGGASLDLSATAKSGTAPGTSATGRSCTTGGAWKGPNGTDGFPMNGFVQNTMTNSAGDAPRVNLKNNANYAITAAITEATNSGPKKFEGYTTTAGDGGLAIVDGGSPSASYVMLAVTNSNIAYEALKFQNNGTTSGTSVGVTCTNGGGERTFRRCVFSGMRGYGLTQSGTGDYAIECEAFACGAGNGANSGGFANTLNGPVTYVRCISHDNTGSNVHGFYSTAGASYFHCIADSNGADGFHSAAASLTMLMNCDSYNNGGDGLELSATSACDVYVENSNFVDNGGWGINGSGSGARHGHVVNCAFGSGTAANTSGTTTGLKSIVETASVTLTSNVTPWTDPGDGDFRISHADAKGTGRGVFLQTQSGYGAPNATLGYPDIGAAQHVDAGGGNVIIPKRKFIR